MPSECEVFSRGLRQLSRITHQLGKCDLEPKSGFPDAMGSHPLSNSINQANQDRIFNKHGTRHEIHLSWKYKFDCNSVRHTWQVQPLVLGKWFQQMVEVRLLVIPNTILQVPDEASHSLNLKFKCNWLLRWPRASCITPSIFSPPFSHHFTGRSHAAWLDKVYCPWLHHGLYE